MSRYEKITQLLTQAFSPTLLEVTDESHKHAGHPGVGKADRETHFHIHMESHAFIGLSRVECHRKVNLCLGSLFSEGLHALRLTLSIPD